MAMEKVAIPAGRVMRIVWFGFVLAGVMMIGVAIAIPARTANHVEPPIEWVLTVMGLSDVVLGLFARKFLIRLARRAPQATVGSAALNQWFTGSTATLAYIFSCNLFALLLHFLGARAGFVELLFGVGMISLLLWRPGTPPISEAGNLQES